MALQWESRSPRHCHGASGWRDALGPPSCRSGWRSAGSRRRVASGFGPPGRAHCAARPRVRPCGPQVSGDACSPTPCRSRPFPPLTQGRQSPLSLTQPVRLPQAHRLQLRPRCLGRAPLRVRGKGRGSVARARAAARRRGGRVRQHACQRHMVGRPHPLRDAHRGPRIPPAPGRRGQGQTRRGLGGPRAGGAVPRGDHTAAAAAWRGGRRPCSSSSSSSSSSRHRARLPAARPQRPHLRRGRALLALPRAPASGRRCGFRSGGCLARLHVLGGRWVAFYLLISALQALGESLGRERAAAATALEEARQSLWAARGLA